jgi:electron transfer flavoprotein beta subunit
MEILVLVKPVPEAESRLRPTSDGKRLDPEAIKFVLAGYDESAVEQALLLKEAIAGSKVRAATLGPAPRSEEVLRAALALGCDAATWLELPPGHEPDLVETARALALLFDRAPADLVLLGKQTGDHENGLLPTALAAKLGRPGFSAVVDLRYDAGTSRFKFARASEGGEERWEVPAPIVIGLQQAWNDPRTAKLQNILKSRKMPIDRIAAPDVAAAMGNASRTVPVKFTLPPPRTGAKMIEYQTPEEAAQKLVRALRDDAKVLP